MPRTQDVWKQLKIDGIAGCQGPKTYCEQQKCSLFKLSCKLLASRSYSPCTSSIRSASHCTNLTEVTLSVHKQMDWQWIGHKQMATSKWIGNGLATSKWMGNGLATSKWMGNGSATSKWPQANGKNGCARSYKRVVVNTIVCVHAPFM